ncbi:ImmA/IrrE family metallo-endopeptidase [Bacillus licheniformis]|uniref:ImmA/IrrE family metallo-endopeptidase n=1 Tax=Bacillus licheniformis TaxID=1402 RepID=UPI000AF36FEA|nr:ImmA/IrrE family metallo-endopeptidase [Bacillus licheniformis]
MNYNMRTLIPIIPASEYDNVAKEFLEDYFPEALLEPRPVPILDIARNMMGLDVQFICLSEELDVYGMTVFADGLVEIFNPEEGLYESRFFKRKTILIDPEAYKKTNVGCVNNTIAHECVHWYKHRMYYRMQNYVLPRQAKYCKCYIEQLPYATEEEIILENQAIGIAPRILMPKSPFIEKAHELNVRYGKDNSYAIAQLAKFFGVSKQSVSIRLEECSLL